MNDHWYVGRVYKSRTNRYAFVTSYIDHEVIDGHWIERDRYRFYYLEAPDIVYIEDGFIIRGAWELVR